LSRLSKEKNIELAIRSLAKLPSNFCLLIVGEGPHRQTLEKLVNRLSLESRVHFMGSVLHEKVPSIMKSCDIFLFPSITETQGLNLLEALYCGLPVVATSSDVSIEWVPNFAGNVVSNEVLSFSNAILEISKKFNFSDSENISKWANQFSIESTVKAMADAYEDIISRKKLSHQLYTTGWQSWSTKPNSLIRLPTRNYSPGKDNYICASTKGRSSDSRKIYGWCSWYAYHNDINASKIFKQADFIKEHSRHLPLEYLILDDGWTKWGDWLQTDTSKFPGGLSSVAAYLKERDLKLGIWLAPFLAEKDSQVFIDHPDWFVTYNGVLTEGFKAIPVIDSYWNFRRYILDITNLDVQDYLHSCIDSLVKTYDIDMLKLDFLYAPYFDKSLTSKEAGKLIHEFLLEVKSRNPNIHINGCGVPLSCGVGVVDSMRISVDTIVPYLDGVPVINSIVHNAKVRTVLESITIRKFTEEYWLLDPDVFVCRKSLGIKESLLWKLHDSIKSLNGNILLGDDLT
ncbi:glycosyltransferase, partial [Candidatus Dojkabacteria bacterium]|nr:glycosyltransferase [Candidatus Dojkabacteria bacterium]